MTAKKTSIPTVGTLAFVMPAVVAPGWDLTDDGYCPTVSGPERYVVWEWDNGAQAWKQSKDNFHEDAASADACARRRHEELKAELGILRD